VASRPNRMRPDPTHSTHASHGAHAAPARQAAPGDAVASAVGPALGALVLAALAPPALASMAAAAAADALPARRAARAENVVGGGQDRMHHLAMVPASAMPALRMRAPGRADPLGPARPGSRVDCLRRCGSDGFCDPSSPSGCGGEYCLAGRDQV
jgi:hypothetical protein